MQNKNFRAKQFIPFDALKGLKEALKEKEEIIVSKKELSIDQQEELSKLLTTLEKNEIITLVYYRMNKYIQVTGMISKIDYYSKMIVIVKEKISFDDIIEIRK